jgi:hypothetical protein
MNSLSSFLQKITPWLAVATDATTPGLFAAGCKTVGDAIGATDLSIESLTSSVVSATPGALANLKKAEAEFALRMQSLGFLTIQSFTKANTVVEEVPDMPFTSKKSFVPAILAVTVTMGFFGIMGLMLGGIWKPTDNPSLLILLGSLGSSWGAIVSFYFGSSAGSAHKDELLAASVPASTQQ